MTHAGRESVVGSKGRVDGGRTFGVAVSGALPAFSLSIACSLIEFFLYRFAVVTVITLENRQRSGTSCGNVSTIDLSLVPFCPAGTVPAAPFSML